jgi:hypothetical protein
MIASTLFTLAGWLSGLLFLAIGIVNTFWGNDPFYGVFLVLLSLLYLPPVHQAVKQKFGVTLPVWIKITLGLFILWSALGVGELFDKIELMRDSFRD